MSTGFEGLEDAEYHVVPDDYHGLELDEYLCLLFAGRAKGFLRQQVRTGRVLVDGEPALPSQRVRGSQVLVLAFDQEEGGAAPVAPEEQVPVLYEDEHLMVVDKPAGLAVEPERWKRDAATLAGALLERARSSGASAVDAEASGRSADAPGAADATDSESGESGLDPADEQPLEFRPRLVHRLDKDTTGCVVAAKDLATERLLRAAFERGLPSKRYLALVEGEHPLPDGEMQVIDRPLLVDAKKGGRVRVSGAGKPSQTEVRVLERFHGYTLLECRPRTGRTHQIRVHLSAEGFPLVVDPLYGRRDALLLSELKRNYRPKRGRPERPLCSRLTLHAASIAVPTRLPDERALAPVPAEIVTGPTPDGDWVCAVSDIPKDLFQTLRQLRKVRPLQR